ncbi:MAG: tetratricopeptide repeat protein [Planctomycetes bacterium]|nr:tetratricopeptide repeat protein [Planctomycetota bacterium]
MSIDNRFPLLDRLYLHYLEDEDSAAFIVRVSRHYMTSTLERLAEYGEEMARRGAVLALGFLASYESNPVLGRALKDRDRVVRILAENAIREMWYRAGSESQRQQLAIIIRLNDSYRFEEAVEQSTDLIEQAPGFAEAWNQRAIAHYRLRHFEDAANDCQQTLELNPYHFGAAVGMAHCYLELGEGFAALECFRRAIDLNPNLEAVKGQIEYLERELKET